MQRPTSVTVFGILNLVFGAWGLCGLGMAAVMFMVPQNPNMDNMNNPVLELMQEDTVYRAFNMVATGLGFVATVVLIAAGVGLLKMKPWGRTASIGYSIYAIVMGLVGAVINYVFLMAPLLEKAENLPGGPEKAGLIGGALGGTFGSCIGLIYPVILLIFMMRPNVKAAFTTPHPGEPSFS